MQDRALVALAILAAPMDPLALLHQKTLHVANFQRKRIVFHLRPRLLVQLQDQRHHHQHPLPHRLGLRQPQRERARWVRAYAAPEAVLIVRVTRAVLMAGVADAGVGMGILGSYLLPFIN